MQPVSSRTWTRVTVSISYDDNHYTTGTSLWTILLLVLFLYAVISLFFKAFLHGVFDPSYWCIHRSKFFSSFFFGTYTPGQKYKITLKNEEKDIVYNFLIMKIRYMTDKVKRHLNLKLEEISIHFLHVY